MSQLLAGLVLLLLSVVGASLGLVSGQGVLGGLGTRVHFFAVDSAGCLGSLLLALIDVLSPVQAIILQLHQVHLYELVEILLRGSLGFVTAVTLLIFLQIHTDDHFLLLLHRSSISRIIVPQSLVDAVCATHELLLLEGGDGLAGAASRVQQILSRVTATAVHAPILIA